MLKTGPIRRFFLILFTWLTLSIILLTTTFAHPGRTDSFGCHTCRSNCPNWGLDYGEYHCHRAKVLPQPEEPIRSKFGEGGTGYTVPAPEYSNPNNTPKADTARKNPENNKITAEDIVIGGGILGGLGWLLKKIISSLK